ncbi:hypothetical protein S7335_4538 [Synechococcus sp. PCC 7335]|nr:hypothetical protein [Synechococcus sp. PCC 7335]EDX86831.1 hypothetical protein S7335_4538 [Synechococcus sp. PCC 7335]
MPQPPIFSPEAINEQIVDMVLQSNYARRLPGLVDLKAGMGLSGSVL